MGKVEEVKVSGGSVRIIASEGGVSVVWCGPGPLVATTQFEERTTDEVRRMLKDAIAALRLADKAMGVELDQHPGEPPAAEGLIPREWAEKAANQMADGGLLPEAGPDYSEAVRILEGVFEKALPTQKG